MVLTAFLQPKCRILSKNIEIVMCILQSGRIDRVRIPCGDCIPSVILRLTVGSLSAHCRLTVG